MSYTGTETIDVTAITSGLTVPSARFRIRQHLAPLARRGLRVKEACPFIESYSPPPSFLKSTGIWPTIKLAAHLPGLMRSRLSTITWLQRTLLSDYVSIEKFFGKPLLLDIDDAIWLDIRNEDKLKRLAEISSGVIAGNDYIKDYFSKWAQNTWTVPTAVDTTRWTPLKTGHKHDFFRIGWSGTAGGFPELYTIENALAVFLSRHKNVRLLVMAERHPSFSLIPMDKVEFISWTPAMEVETVQNMNIGIMPLPDNAWSRAKCAYKLLLYMATGCPVIASPVGINRQLLMQSGAGFSAVDTGQWLHALETLYTQPAQASGMGASGRDFVAANYSTELIADRLLDIFQKTAECHGK